MRIAIYDLDRTLTAKPTFTPYLLFAARRLAPWRLALAPIWVFAMLGHRIGLYDRTKLKTFGMRLMLGISARADERPLDDEFAPHHIDSSGWRDDVLELLEEDRKAGAKLIVATAAFGFYARSFARMLAVDEVIATEWDDGRIVDGNCYGETKFLRVKHWLEERGIAREEATIRMVSDSFADTPLLDWADEAIFVTDSARDAAKARRRGWQVI